MTTWSSAAKVVLIVAILVAAGLLISRLVRSLWRPAPDAAGQQTIVSGGVERTYTLHVPPETEAASDPRPLVFVFHGAGGSGPEMQRSSGIDAVADEVGVIAVYPDAAGENWSEGIGSRPERLGVDDVGFVRDLLAELESACTIDPNRVYAIGFSQGGFFAHRLAIDLPERIVAYATVAASMSRVIADRYETPAPTPVLMMHGTLDATFLRQGASEGFFSYLAQDALVELLSENNECVDAETAYFTLDSGEVSAEVHGSSHADATGRVLVEHYTIVGGSHAWKWGQLDTAKTILEFLLRFSRVDP